MPETEKYVPVGRVVGVHGLKGALKVEPLTDFAARFSVGTSLLVSGEERAIIGVHVHKGQFRVRLEGIETPEAAEPLRGQTLHARDEGLELHEDEFRVRDLIGCRVVDADGAELGEVEAILPSPAQDLLQVGSLLIPMAHEFVHEIDIEGRVIRVETIEGMREDA